MSSPEFRGVVLAGGQSRRFGPDKAFAKTGGRTFVERAAGLLRGLGLETIVIGRPSADYASTGCRFVTDEIAGKGPLGGLYTACGLFPGACLVVLTCDMPRLEAGILRDLMARHPGAGGATLFRTSRGVQPFPGIYDSMLRAAAGRALRNEELSMNAFLDSISASVISWQGDERFFHNVNRPEEAAALPDFSMPDKAGEAGGSARRTTRS